LGLGGEGDEGLAGIGGELEAFVGEEEVADDRVVERLGSSGVPAHVVRVPEGAEGLALGRELSDELVEVAVVGVAAGLGTQKGDSVPGGSVPVRVEV
jgi:hypothetical protein